MAQTTWLRPKEMWEKTGIKPRSLKHARMNKLFAEVRWSPGGRIPYFDINEVRKIFPNAK